MNSEKIKVEILPGLLAVANAALVRAPAFYGVLTVSDVIYQMIDHYDARGKLPFGTREYDLDVIAIRDELETIENHEILMLDVSPRGRFRRENSDLIAAIEINCLLKIVGQGILPFPLISRAREQGRIAYWDGKNLKDCPYNDQPHLRNWRKGWREAHNDELNSHDRSL